LLPGHSMRPALDGVFKGGVGDKGVDEGALESGATSLSLARVTPPATSARSSWPTAAGVTPSRWARAA
jgi:hypothetical protein